MAVATYILIHGAYHGGWCWRKVTPLLAAAGHAVIAPDLPGHGAGEAGRAVTLDDYVDAVCGHLRGCATPAVLVGHSMAGVVISAAAEREPERIRYLVYVTAYLPGNDQSLTDLSRADPESRVRVAKTTGAGAGAFVAVRDEVLVEAFYGDSPAADVAFARARLVPQAVAPMTQPVRLGAKRFGRVPRLYIGCRRDRAITPALQQRMLAVTPCQRTVELDCDHSPFFSAPEALAAALLSV
jgi:pimeloyl-ACP methyl ester carboxylesterase